MTPRQRRLALEKIAADGRFAQFGQKHDSSTSNGSEACTHVICQYLIKVWKGIDVTIDEISRVARYVAADVGMNSDHVDRVIKHYGLPYEASWRRNDYPLNSMQMIKLVRDNGPAMVCVNYSVYPLDAELKKNAQTSRLIHAPNGYALQGGRNDLGFGGGHATALLAARWRPHKQEWRPRLIDPDHGSDNRPDVPEFDCVTFEQWDGLWNTGFRSHSGKLQKFVAYVPTQQWNGGV